MPDQTPGQPLTEQPRHQGRMLRGREQAKLQAASTEEMHHEVLDHLVGVHRVIDALSELVVSQRRRVLWSGTAIIGTSGIWHRRLPQGSMAIAVTSYSSNGLVTVAAGPPAGAAPGAGAGTHNVPSGVFAVFNNDTTDWTLYGTAGNALDIQIFSIPITPTASGNI